MEEIDWEALRENSERAVQRLLHSDDTSSRGAKLLRDADELCLHLHTIAVAALLVDGDPQGFFLNLCRAADHWYRLLRTLRARQLPLPASRHNAALLGAVAAGHWELAQQVAQLSETRWLGGEEYRSEYAWAQYLQRMVAPSIHSGESEEALLQYLEEEGDDESRDRLTLAKALREHSRQTFAQSFRHAVLVHGELIEKRAKLFTTPMTRFAPERYIWMEGLALLKLAERGGLPLYEEYHLYCPPLARTPMTVSYGFVPGG